MCVHVCNADCMHVNSNWLHNCFVYYTWFSMPRGAAFGICTEFCVGCHWTAEGSWFAIGNACLGWESIWPASVDVLNERTPEECDIVAAYMYAKLKSVVNLEISSCLYTLQHHTKNVRSDYRNVINLIISVTMSGLTPLVTKVKHINCYYFSLTNLLATSQACN